MLNNICIVGCGVKGWEKNTLIRDNSDPYNYLRTIKDDRIIIEGEDVVMVKLIKT